MITPLLIAGAAAGCVVRELPKADVLGVVLDASSLAPLSGVQVRSRGGTTTSDATGRYRLTVSEGVREITYALPDRTPVRKYVVARQVGEIQQDVLYPAGAPTAAGGSRRLVLQRGPAIDGGGNDLERESGEDNLVSVCDQLGNDESFLALGHRGAGVYSPLWDGDSAIYYSFTRVGIGDDQRSDFGVFRYELDSRKRTRVWGAPKDQLNPEAIALSPDGQSLIGSAQGSSVTLIHDIRSDAPRAESLLQSDTILSSSVWGFSAPVSWAPSAFVYLPVYDKSVQADPGRIARQKPGEGVLEPKFAGGAGEVLTYPLPLADGRVLFTKVLPPGQLTGASIWIGDEQGTSQELYGPAWLAVAYDPAADVLLYIRDYQLHRRDLKSGLDLVIVSYTRSAALQD